MPGVAAKVSPWALGLLGLTLGALSLHPARRFVAAAGLLADLAGPTASVEMDRGVLVRDVAPADGLPFRAKLYVPSGAVHRCMVVGHGVHHLAIDEPRLVRFATELAETGALVLTPALSDLAGYRITASGVSVLGRSVHALRARCPRRHPVGLVGFSFAGGLALLAATDPAVSTDLDYVASVGGYHDLARVMRFLVDGKARAPDGVVARTPHEYGLVILVYDYMDHFVPEEDRELALGAFRAWLEEDRSRAWAVVADRKSLETERLFERLASGRLGELRARLVLLIEEHQGELRDLSPKTRLASIPVPVYLLHGSGDNVIPPEETLWADRELDGRPHRALVTPLIGHVEVSRHPKWTDEFALVRFVAEWL